MSTTVLTDDVNVMHHSASVCSIGLKQSHHTANISMPCMASSLTYVSCRMPHRGLLRYQQNLSTKVFRCHSHYYSSDPIQFTSGNICSR